MNEEKQSDRDRSEYWEGFEAHMEGDELSSNPYPIGDKARIWWYNGYLDRRTSVRLEAVFKRLGVQWP